MQEKVFGICSTCMRKVYNEILGVKCSHPEAGPLEKRKYGERSRLPEKEEYEKVLCMCSDCIIKAYNEILRVKCLYPEGWSTREKKV